MALIGGGMVLLGGFGCLGPKAVTCGNVVCEVGDVCTADGCATEADVEHCSGLADGAECTASTGEAGLCIRGACRQGVAYDTSVEASASTFCASRCTYTHPLGPGQDGVIVIWYYCPGSAEPSSAVLVDGAHAVSLGAAEFMPSGNIAYLVELWYAIAATSTPHLIEVDHGCNDTAWVVSMSATNVDPDTPMGAPVFSSSDVQSITIEMPIASTPGDLVMAGACHGTADVLPPAMPQTIRYLDNLNSDYACGAFVGSTQPGVSPTVTPSFSAGASDFWAFAAVSLHPKLAP
jgi:hypothetical protein